MNQTARAISIVKLNALLHLHIRPIDLVVYQGPLVGFNPKGDLILGGAWRLDAFSAYLFRTWLPGDTVDTITGTPSVRHSRSSRTKE